MNLEEASANLERHLEGLPRASLSVLGSPGSPMYMLDFVVLGAIKRTLNLGRGMISLVNASNMICSRALLRMQIDTVSRLLAYTYVDDPESLASAVIGGEPLKKFKARDGQKLGDGYLIDRMSKAHPWVRTVYTATSGEVHFSEKQFFAAAQVTDERSKTLSLKLGSIDDKFPEQSWVEVVQCFAHLCEILDIIVSDYGAHKVRNDKGTK